MQKERNEFYPKSRNEWRNWLQKNHAVKNHVWLIIYKKESGVPGVIYSEVVEEALCFGWIDSKPNKRDDKSYFLFIAPRKPKSVWSALNKNRIKKMLKENKIAAAGLKKIEAAKKDGSWFALDKVEALEMPPALKKSFLKNKPALKNFEAFPPGVRKQIFQWVTSAKTKGTLDKRVAETVTLAAKNIRANQWKPKS
jgi:uncharacterized protein YdeI (YjbR/CyaY-like superfamily)